MQHAALMHFAQGCSGRLTLIALSPEQKQALSLP